MTESERKKGAALFYINILHQFLFPDFQLQHDRTELHVEVVGPLQLSLVVLPDVQGVPKQTQETHRKMAISNFRFHAQVNK